MTSFEYDQDGNLLLTKNALGQITRQNYDAMNRVTRTIDRLGQATELEYDLAGQVVSLKGPRGGLTTLKYDALGRPVELKDRTGGVTRQTYDPKGNLTETIDGRGGVQKRQYDALNRPTEMTDALGGVSKMSYDGAGQLFETKDAAGHVTKAEYDALGRLTRLTDAAGGLQTQGYDPDGLLTRSSDQLGRVTTQEYDAAGQLTRRISPRGAEIRLSYDLAGNVQIMTDPAGKPYVFEYDASNAQTAQTDPLGQRTEMGRDALGRMTSRKNPKGAATRYRYDPMDRLVEVLDARGGSSNYEYDSEGNLATYRDARGGVERWNYDLMSRPTSYTNGMGSVWSYSYDPNGNQVGTRDANGQNLTEGFDLLNRSTSLTYPDGFVQKRGYDTVGNLTSLSDRAGTSSFTYDALDRMTNEKRDGRSTGAAYDGVGNLTSLTFSDGKTQKRSFDADNHLERIVDEAGGEFTYSRDLLGRELELTYPNGAKTVKSYDAAGGLTMLSNWGPAESGKLLSRYSYTLDANGNRTAVKSFFDAATLTPPGGPASPKDSDEVEPQSQGLAPVTKVPGPRTPPAAGGASAEFSSEYRYDELDRVTNEKHSTGLNIAYGLDAVGNVTRRQVTGSGAGAGAWQNTDQTLNYNGANQLSRIDEAGRNTTLSYDPNGNRVAKRDTLNGDAFYNYDYENRLTKVDAPRSGSPTGGRSVGLYTYDGLGRLQSEDNTLSGAAGVGGGASEGGTSSASASASASPSKLTRLYWGLQGIGQQDNTALATTRHYTLGEDGSVLGLQSSGGTNRGGPKRGGPGASSSTARYLQHDGLGSPTIATDSSGAVVGSQGFASYGGRYAETGLANFAGLGFTGQDATNGAGLTHFYARWYDATTSRWLSEDPYRGKVGDPAQHNRSLYVRANPVNATDPTGYFGILSFLLPIIMPSLIFIVPAIIKIIMIVAAVILQNNVLVSPPSPAIPSYSRSHGSDSKKNSNTLQGLLNIAWQNLEKGASRVWSVLSETWSDAQKLSKTTEQARSTIWQYKEFNNTSYAIFEDGTEVNLDEALRNSEELDKLKGVLEINGIKLAIDAEEAKAKLQKVSGYINTRSGKPVSDYYRSLRGGTKLSQLFGTLGAITDAESIIIPLLQSVTADDEEKQELLNEAGKNYLVATALAPSVRVAYSGCSYAATIGLGASPIGAAFVGAGCVVLVFAFANWLADSAVPKTSKEDICSKSVCTSITTNEEMRKEYPFRDSPYSA